MIKWFVLDGKEAGEEEEEEDVGFCFFLRVRLASWSNSAEKKWAPDISVARPFLAFPVIR